MHGSGADETYNYTWDYNTNIVADCDGKGDFSTVVTDPNAHNTTYCYNRRTDSGENGKTWVYDAKGNARSTEYSADNRPVNMSSEGGLSASAVVGPFDPGHDRDAELFAGRPAPGV